MAEFNVCSKLYNPESVSEAEKYYDDLVTKGQDPFQEMINNQLKLQTELAKKLPKYNSDPTKLKTMGDILDHFRNQNDAIDDERREQYLSMGEMSRGDKEASAIFKPWKQRHEEARNKKWDDLSDDDKLEILFEYIDEFHFFMNKGLGLKLDAKQIFILYYLKQRENMNRYNNNY